MRLEIMMLLSPSAFPYIRRIVSLSARRAYLISLPDKYSVNSLSEIRSVVVILTAKINMKIQTLGKGVTSLRP